MSRSYACSAADIGWTRTTAPVRSTTFERPRWAARTIRLRTPRLRSRRCVSVTEPPRARVSNARCSSIRISRCFKRCCGRNALQPHVLNRAPELVRKIVAKRDHDRELALLKTHVERVAEGIGRRLVLRVRHRHFLQLVRKSDVLPLRIEDRPVTVSASDVGALAGKHRQISDRQ